MRGSLTRPALFLALAWLLWACSAPGKAVPIPSPFIPISTPAPSGLPQAANGSALQPSLNAPAPSTLPPEPFQASPTPTPAATQTPVLRQITQGGCCTQPFWSPDSRQILFVDKPAEDAPAGLWGVPVTGGEPQLVTDRLGAFSPDMSLVAYPDGQRVLVERRATGEQWSIANGGRAISFSPDNQLISWTAGASGPPFDTSRRVIWLARADGSEARAVIELLGGGFAGWLPGGRILVSGRLTPQEQFPAYYAIPVQGGESVELARSERLRGGLLSPDGAWLAYQVTFAAKPDENGLWVLNLETREKVRLEVFGAYRWRGANRLLVVPLEPGSPSHRLWEYDPASKQGQPLTNPSVTSFKIGNGDWSVSPDGLHVVFVSAQDGNLWVIDLSGVPEPG